jgi:hypothetical protein
VKTAGRSGYFRRKVTVSSNDPQTPNFYFIIKGKIVGDLDIKPTRVVFAYLEKSEKGTADLSITVNEPDQVKITSVTVKDPLFNVQQKEGTPEKGGRYEVTFNGSGNIGAYSAKVKVVLEGSTKPLIEVQVWARVFGNFSYPPSLIFRKKTAEFKPKNFVISTKDGADLTVTKIDDPEKLLNFKITKNDAERVMITAEVADQNAKHDKPFEHRFMVHTSDKEEPKIEIRYHILPKQKKSIKRKAPSRNH